MSAVLARTSFRLTPLAVAITAALHHAPASAAAVDWLPDADGFWDVATNWSSNPALPGAADDVTLNVGGAVVRTITHRTGTTLIRSVTSQENFSLLGGALEIEAASSMSGVYEQTGGVLGGTGTITLSGAGSWTGGEMIGMGTTRVTGALTIDGPYYQPTYLHEGRTLQNDGTVTWRLGNDGYANYLITGEGAQIVNNGTWVDEIETGIGGTSWIYDGYGGEASVFRNNGTYHKTGGGTTELSIGFDNSGAVEVDAGSLNLSGGGTHSGSFVIGNDGTLGFTGGAHTFTTSSSLSGFNFTFGGANLEIAGSYDVSGTTTVTGGTHHLSGPVANLGSALHITAGVIDIDTLSATVMDYTQSGGTLRGNGVLTIGGAGSWTGGEMIGMGTTRVTGALTIDGPYYQPTYLHEGRTLQNDGTVTWRLGNDGYANYLITGEGAQIVNNGTWVDEIETGIGGTSWIYDGYGGEASVFRNNGTYHKTGGGTTEISIAFDNDGEVIVDAGILRLSNGGAHAGDFTGLGGEIQFSGGTHALGDTSDVTATSMTFSGGVVDHAGTYDVSGTTNVVGGTANLTGTITSIGTALQVSSGAFNAIGVGGALNLNSITLSGGTTNLGSLALSTNEYVHGGGTLRGMGPLTIGGAGSWNGGEMIGMGTTRVTGALTIDGPYYQPTYLHEGRTLQNDGTVTWRLGNDGYANYLITGEGAQIVNNGTWVDEIETGIGGTSWIYDGYGGEASVFRNNGTYHKTGGGTTGIEIGFDNSGAIGVENGILNITADVTQHTGNTLTGGTWHVSDTGILNLDEPGAQNIVTNQADVTLDGAAASFARINTLTNNQGAFRLLGNRNFTATGAFTNSGVLQLGGGTFGAPGLSNTVSGEVFGFGTVTPTIVNSGLVRAAGGTLTASGGIDGASGTIQIDPGATLALGADSDADFLVNDGTLNLGVFDVTVARDYTNANFGSGNGFNARANVNGSGAILAGGNTAQALTGDVSGGSTATPELAFGNLHVGDVVTRSFRVANTGASGPDLRGALQTSVNGGSITDARLSGSGVTAGNFGPIATQGATDEFEVSFTGNSAGALVNQRVALVNNFDDVAEQVLNFSGAIYRYAEGAIENAQPIDFGAYRVGDTASSVGLAIRNAVADDGYSEKLDASAGSASAGFAVAGSFDALAAGATNTGGIEVGLDTSVAGAKSGSASVNLVSDGAGTSNLGQTARPQQSVNLQGKVYAPAIAEVQTANVDFGIVHVGDTVAAKQIGVRNAASGALTDSLLGSVSAVPAGFAGSGSLGAGLAAGQASDALAVTLNTAAAGVFGGQAALSFASHNADMQDLALPGQQLALSAQVNHYANPVLSQAGGAGSFSGSGASFVLDFGRLVQDSGGVVGTLALTNLISGPADELGATFDVGAGSYTLGGFDDFSGLVAGGVRNLSVSFDPLLVGLFEQTVRLDLFGENASGFHGALGSMEVLFRAEVAPVPVPAAIWMLGSGIVGLALTRRRAA